MPQKSLDKIKLFFYLKILLKIQIYLTMKKFKMNLMNWLKSINLINMILKMMRVHSSQMKKKIMNNKKKINNKKIMNNKNKINKKQKINYQNKK